MATALWCSGSGAGALLPDHKCDGLLDRRWNGSVVLQWLCAIGASQYFTHSFIPRATRIGLKSIFLAFARPGAGISLAGVAAGRFRHFCLGVLIGGIGIGPWRIAAGTDLDGNAIGGHAWRHDSLADLAYEHH